MLINMNYQLSIQFCFVSIFIYLQLLVQTWIQLCTHCQSTWRCGRAFNCDRFVLNNFFQVKSQFLAVIDSVNSRVMDGG